MTKQPVPDELIRLVNRMADAGGEVIRRYFRAKFDVETKGDQSPVTIADRETEQAIRAILKKERPQDAIWGEEYGSEDMNAEFLWVIDPIDGTGSFMTGRPTFGTLIGLYRGEEAILGIIDQPIANDRWIGAQGHATLLNGTEVRCGSCPALKDARIGTCGANIFAPEGWTKFERISRTAPFTLYGGDCYLYGQLSCGWLDAVIDEKMKLHDFAALIPVIEGAGGKITDWQGMPLGRKEKSNVLASGDARLHGELCGMLA